VIAPVAAKVPVVTGELGEYDCTSSFIDSYMAWADAHGVSYLAWAWDAGSGWLNQEIVRRLCSLARTKARYSENRIRCTLLRDRWEIINE
jgi:hypothetical protein